MKTSLASFRNHVALFLVLLTPCLARAQSQWIGANNVSATTNWSDTLNWSTAAPPDNTDVVFTNTGTTMTVGTIDNVVDSSVSISSLTYSQTATNTTHTTFIAPGVTLTILGASGANGSALFAGAPNTTDVPALTNRITGGAGSALVVNNVGANVLVRQGPNGSGMANRTTLDLSGLETFTATVGRVLMSGNSPNQQNRSTGRLILAKTNYITASGTSPALVVGESTSNNGSGSTLFLGQTNVLFVNNIVVGRTKESGSRIAFNSGLTAPVVYIRAADGSSAVATWTLGDGAADSGTTTCNGTADFTGGTVDALVGTMQVGRGSSGGTGANQSVGTVTFNAGTIEIGTLQLGMQGGATAKGGSGTMNVNGGTLIVNTVLEMGRTAGGTGTGLTQSRLNINGGTVRAQALTGDFAASTNNIISITNGTLIVTNTASPSIAGLTRFGISNATLRLNAVAANPTVQPVVFQVGGTTNVIHIANFAAGRPVSYPFTYQIIKYSGAVAGTYNIGLGSLPPFSPPFVGYLTNNTVTAAVELVITGGPAPPRSISWTGETDGNWDTTTLNWNDGVLDTTYQDEDNVLMGDGPTIRSISLNGTFLPSAVTVNNSPGNDYTFGGGGSLSGSMGLTKSGSGTLILDNGTPNDYTGATLINAGTVQVGNNGFSGSLGSGGVTDNGSLVFNRIDEYPVANVISGTGTLTQNGTGVLLLNSANTYTGVTSVAQGTLRVGSAGALGTIDGPTIVSSGATLDFNARNIGQEPVVVSGPGLNSAGALYNSGAQVLPAVARVTLAGNSSFGGTGRWDLRSASTGDPTGSSLNTVGDQGFTLTKVGMGQQVSIVGTTVSPALGDIDIVEGTLSFEVATTSMGNTESNLFVRADGQLQFFNATNRFNKKFTIFGNGAISPVGSVRNASGSSTIIGPMTLNDACIFDVAGTSLTLSNSISGTGSLLKTSLGTLILGGNASHAGGTVVNIGTLILNGTVSAPVTNVPGTTLAGSGTSANYTLVQGMLNPGPTNGPGTLTVGDLVIDPGATMTFDLNSNNTIGGGVNDLLQVTTSFTASDNPITINPIAGRLQAGSYRLINYVGLLLGSLNSTVVPSTPTRYGLALDTSTPGQVNLNVTGSSASLVWNAIFGNGNWDIYTSQNWLSNSVQDYYFNGDDVLFNDQGGVSTLVSITTPVLPNSFTNNSSVNNFSFTGLGRISGALGLVKQGSSTMTLATSNDFTGPVSVEAGTLKVGVSAALGTTNSGTTIANGATLDVGGNATANLLNLGFESVTVSGSGVGGLGAILNSNTNSQQNALRYVTLAGDTTFGGPGNWNATGNPGRWDIRSQAGNTDIASAANAFLSTGNQPFKLTKTGSNYVAIVGVLVDPALAEINVQQGLLGFEHASTMGDATRTLTVSSGAGIQLWQNWPSNALNKVIVLNGDGANPSILNGSGDNIFIGPITLNGNCVFSVATTALTLSNNVVNGPGGLIKTNTGVLTIYDTLSYNGNTAINQGTLALMGAVSLANSPVISLGGGTLNVTGRSDGTLTLVSGQALNGNGTIQGLLVAGANSTVSPGAGGIGVLTVNSNVTLQAGSTTFMELSKTPLTNDQLRATASVPTTITYGGTLSVTNISGTLVGGETFKLFSASNYLGSFSSITPTTPGPGLLWNTNTLATSGTLGVIAIPVPNITSITTEGGNIVLRGGNGLAGNQYYVRTSTNIATPLANWPFIWTNVFDGSGNFSFTNGAPTDPQRFYLIQYILAP